MGGTPRGGKPQQRHCGKAIEAQLVCGQIKPEKSRVLAGSKQCLGKKIWRNTVRCQKAVEFSKGDKAPICGE